MGFDIKYPSKRITDRNILLLAFFPLEKTELYLPYFGCLNSVVIYFKDGQNLLYFQILRYRNMLLPFLAQSFSNV